MRDDPRRDPSTFPPPTVQGVGSGPANHYDQPWRPLEPKPGLRTAVAHFYAWIQTTSKTVIVLLGLWGTISTPISVGLAYWATHLGWATQDEQARASAEVRRVGEDVKVVLATVGGVGPKVDRLGDKLEINSNDIARLESWAKQRGFKK